MGGLEVRPSVWRKAFDDNGYDYDWAEDRAGESSSTTGRRTGQASEGRAALLCPYAMPPCHPDSGWKGDKGRREAINMLAR